MQMTRKSAVAMLADPTNFLDRLLASDRYWLAAVLLVLTVQCGLVISHIPWLDEWQALQIATGSTSAAALFENLRYEGHPPLWYWLLQAIGHFVPFAFVLKAAVLPLAVAAQAVILFKSPFSRGERVLIACGALMMAEYLTLSRSMALGVAMLVFMLAYWHHARLPWLAIILLPMCDFLFGVFSLLAVGARWHERRIWLPGLIFWLASGLFAAWSVRPAPDSAPALYGGALWELIRVAENLGTAFLPLQAEDWALQWNSTLPGDAGLVAFPLFLLFGYYQLRTDKPSLLAFGAFIAVVIAFSTFIYSLQFRHVSLAALLLILLRWRLALGGMRPDRWFRGWLIVGAVCGAITTIQALRTPFDRAPDVAAWIARHGLSQENWLTFPDSRAQGVSAISGIVFERIDQRCRLTFVRWNERGIVNDPAAFEHQLERHLADQGGSYLLSEYPLTKISPRLIRRIAYFAGGRSEIDYYLFAVGSGQPSRGLRAPFCTPSMRLGNGRPAINEAGSGLGQSAAPTPTATIRPR